jgi:hypothetical protein
MPVNAPDEFASFLAVRCGSCKTARCGVKEFAPSDVALHVDNDTDDSGSTFDPLELDTASNLSKPKSLPTTPSIKSSTGPPLKRQERHRQLYTQRVVRADSEEERLRRLFAPMDGSRTLIWYRVYCSRLRSSLQRFRSSQSRILMSYCTMRSQ